jgi:hypothetical protein
VGEEERFDRCFFLDDDNTDVSLLSLRCDRQWRITAFVDAMSRCGLSSFHTWSRCAPIIFTARKLRQVANERLDHRCEKLGSCIFELCLEKEIKAVEKLLRDEMGHFTDLWDEDATEDLDAWEHSEGSLCSEHDDPEELSI